MKKALYIFFIVLFFAACVLPTVGLIVKGPGEAAANEAPAYLAGVKNYDGTWNLDYPGNLRDYIAKGFFLRLECITGWDTLCAKLLKTSANDDVIIGPDGWLFYGTAADEISGADVMTERELWCAARSLYLMQEYVQGKGAEFIFTVPCGKYNLYPEHAPVYVTVDSRSNRELLQGLLNEMGVNYADLYAAFTAVDEELYWKYDSHWNARGAALAADTILNTAGIKSSYFSGPFASEDNHSGDLYNMLYPKGKLLETDYSWTPGFSFGYVGSFATYDDITILTENAGGAGSLLMFRDSSGRNLYPYMAQSFATAQFSRLNSYRLDLIESQNADLVVVELAERTLNYLLKYPAVYAAPERDANVLDGMTETESELSFDTSGTTMADYMKITGTTAETAVDAPVYLKVGDVVYEAIPGEGTFTAWIPMDTDGSNITVYSK